MSTWGGLELIDISAAAAAVLVRKQARRAWGDLLLAARQQVMRFLTVTAWRLRLSGGVGGAGW